MTLSFKIKAKKIKFHERYCFSIYLLFLPYISRLYAYLKKWMKIFYLKAKKGIFRFFVWWPLLAEQKMSQIRVRVTDFTLSKKNSPNDPELNFSAVLSLCIKVIEKHIFISVFLCLFYVWHLQKIKFGLIFNLMSPPTKNDHYIQNKGKISQISWKNIFK